MIFVGVPASAGDFVLIAEVSYTPPQRGSRIPPKATHSEKTQPVGRAVTRVERILRNLLTQPDGRPVQSVTPTHLLPQIRGSRQRSCRAGSGRAAHASSVPAPLHHCLGSGRDALILKARGVPNAKAASRGRFAAAFLAVRASGRQNSQHRV